MVNDGSANRSGSRNQNIADFWKLIKPLILVEKFPRNEGIWSTSEGADFIERYISLLRGLFFENAFAHGDRTKLSQLTLFPSGYSRQETSSWEQRKLGNCGTTYGGLSGKTKEDFGHGNARFVPYTNVFDNPLTDTKRLETVEIDSSQNKVAYGDTFFTVSSETPDEVGMSSVWLSDQDDVYLNSFCFGYRQDSTFDPHYLAYMLRSSSIRSDLTLLAQGISRFNISKNKVMELSVPVPSAAEQKQIGQYFARLDSLITLHQRESRFADTG